ALLFARYRSSLMTALQELCLHGARGPAPRNVVRRFGTQRLLLRFVAAIHFSKEDVFDRLLRAAHAAEVGDERCWTRRVNRLECGRGVSRRLSGGCAVRRRDWRFVSY